MKDLTLGYSPCPNDTFIFYALVHGKVDCADIRVTEVLEDVETLNRMASGQKLDITKASFAAFAGLSDNYALLRSGGALGRGCGPLIVARGDTELASLKGRPIAVPGLNTTAYMLLGLLEPALLEHAVPMPFDKIMPAVRDGQVEAGLIIHESRFTYHDFGLVEIEDLGRWWETETAKPIPLGCIIARRELGPDMVHQIDSLVRRSLEYANSHRAEPTAYIKVHSQEMADKVIQEHIALYVNDFSLDLGEEGISAVETLFDMAADKGLIPRPKSPLFID